MTQIRLAELVRIIGGKTSDILGDPDRSVACAMPFEQATEDCVTFADNAGLLKRLSDSRAGAVIVPRQFSQQACVDLILSDNPRLAFARVMHYFHPRTRSFSGISSMAFIGENFCCGGEAAIAPFVFIGRNVILGRGVTLHPHACIGDNVSIGDDTEIMANVSVMDKCVIGRRVVIQAGTVIGSDGYGYTPDEGRHFKIPQVGIVQIDDDVEIGACNTIDRATFGKTWIGKGVKTDNQVHIAHNVTIGEHTIVVAQVGIAGSTSVGKNVILAGQAGIGGHISIGDGAVVGPQAGVARNVDAGKTVSGTPEMAHSRWLRVQHVLSGLPEMKKQIAELARRVASVEKKTTNSDDK